MANATSTQLQELYVAYFGRAADPAGLDYWKEKGITTAAFAANMYAQPEFKSEYGSKSVDTQVNQIYKNLFDREADLAGLSYWTQQINLGNLQLAEIAVHLIYAAQNNDGSAADKLALSNRTAAASAYTDKIGETAAGRLAYTALTTDPWSPGDNITEAKSYLADIDGTTAHTTAGIAASVATINANGAPAKAASHDLTVGIDDLDGGDGKDTFNAGLSDSIMTMSSNDVIAGGSGIDSMNITINTASSYSPTFTSVEKLYTTSTATATFSLENITGVTTLENTSSTGALTFDNIADTSISLGVNGNSADTTFTFTDAAIAGSSDSVSLALATAANTITIANVETINISTSGGTSTLAGLVATSATTLNVSGSKDLSLGTLSTKIATIAAASFTGDLTATGTNTTANTITGGSGNDIISGAAGNDVLTGGAGNDSLTSSTGEDTLSGGAGNDTFVMAGALTSADTITGGDGTDTVEINAAVTVDNGVNVSGIEALKIENATSSAAATQDLDAFDGVSSITVGAHDHNVILNDVAAGADLKYTSSQSHTGNEFNLKTDTSSDSLTITLGTKTAGITLAAVTANDAETLNLVSKGAANTITDLNVNDLTTLNISGDYAFNITDAIDGSTSVETVTITSTADTDVDLNENTVDVTMTGGVGNDTLAGGTLNDTITGGAGNDTLSGDNGVDIITGGAGNDIIGGGGGNDTLSGGDGNDVITTGAGIDTVTGGAGNDTIKFSTDGDLTVSDTIDAGAGTDTVEITTATDISGSSKATLTNVEKVKLTASLGMATFDAAGIASLETLELAAASADSAFTINNLVDAATLKLNAEATTAAITVDTAGTTLTLQIAGDTKTTPTISDAVTLNVSTGSATTNDVEALALDDDVTTTLTLTGSSTDSATLATGNVSNSNILSSVTATTSSSGATITVGTIADADALTSLVANADYGNITFGNIGASGSAEGITTITATADNGATTTLATTTADTTNSTTDLTTTVTATASTAGSTVALGTINNQYGIVNGTLSGAGVVGASSISAEHIDLTWAANTASVITTLSSSDDLTLTSSGSANNSISTLTVADDATITHTGSGNLTISAVTDGIGDFTADASGATGALIISANSATSTTEGAILTGGSNNDTLIGGAADDIITGGAGNDIITGGSRNDTLSGGAGNDTITTGAGTDTVTGGAGNDTIALSTNWSASDSLDGGDGTDTLTMDVTTTQAPTLTSVEKATVGFKTGGAFNAGNTGTLSAITIQEKTDDAGTAAATLINLKDGTQVIVTDSSGDASDLGVVTLDTAASADLTVTARDNTSSNLTITDAVNLTINAASAGRDSGFLTVTIDNSDTKTLTITGADAAYDLQTNEIDATNALTSLTASTSTTSGTITAGQLDVVNSMTSINVDATNANITIGQLGASGSMESLSTLTVAASGGATASLGNLTADTTNSTSDLAMTVTLTSDTSSVVALDAINNQYGSIALTATGAGTFSLGDKASNISFASASTFDLSGATGTNVLNTLGATATGTVTLASEGGSDSVQVDDDATIVIKNFQFGSSGDNVAIDESAFGSAWVNGAAANVVTTSGKSFEEISGSETLAAGADIIVLTGEVYATTGLVETALEAGGTREVVLGGVSAANDDLAVMWSDGSNSYLGSLDITAIETSTAIGVGGSTLTNVVEFTGTDVSTAGTFDVANFTLI